MGKEREAKAAYQEALKLQPDDAQFRIQIENVLARMDKDEVSPLVSSQQGAFLQQVGQQKRRRLALPHLQPLLAKPLQKKTQPKRWRWIVLFGFLLVLFIISSASLLFSLSRINRPPVTSDGIQVHQVGNEVIGLSDGRFVLGTLDLNPTKTEALKHKERAANYVRSGDYPSALAQWDAALDGDNSNDAEALIYRENLRVLISQAPYITFVVDVSFNSEDALSAPVLRGAYVAQKECNNNTQLSGGKKIRLLIANSGSDPNRSKDIATQIVEATKADTHIVGVLGGTTTKISLNMIPILEQAHIPMVGSNPSGNDLTGISSYFFRLMPTNKDQASVLASYVQKKLNPHRVVVFHDANEPYSEDFAQAVMQSLRSLNASNLQIKPEPFTVGGDQAVLAQTVRGLLDSDKPDLIFFTSYKIDDMKTLLDTISVNSKLKVVMGSGYQLVEANASLTNGAPKGYNRVLYATGAFADLWDILAPGKRKPPFFCEYALAFDPYKQHQGPAYCGYPTASDPQNLQKGPPYTYTRPTSYDMLGYDALKTLLEGTRIALGEGEQSFTPEQLRKGLAHITGPQAIQGVTGMISLGADGDSIKKSVVILRVDGANHLQMDAYQGCLLIDGTYIDTV